MPMDYENIRCSGQTVGRVGADPSAVAQRAKAEGVIRHLGGQDGGSRSALYELRAALPTRLLSPRRDLRSHRSLGSVGALVEHSGLQTCSRRMGGALSIPVASTC